MEEQGENMKRDLTDQYVLMKVYHLGNAFGDLFVCICRGLERKRQGAVRGRGKRGQHKKAGVGQPGQQGTASRAGAAVPLI